jgi:peptidoglycan/xylan/chitin deacetylase (PgdA/CDA1 family)
VPASLQRIADDTGLSRSAVQQAVLRLRRRHLLRVDCASATAVPEYTVLRPWRRSAPEAMFILLIVGVAAMILAHTAPFPFLIERFNPGQSVWRMPANGRQPVVYLTYDDGPNPTATPALLDVLEAEGVRATFFVIDEHLTEETAPIVRRMAAEGHAVALHSGTRGLMLESPEELASTLTAAAERLERLAGARPCRFFRPHAGWRGGRMYAGLRRINFKLAGWSWGLWDWNWYRQPEARAVARRLLRRASAGDIIVMHDGHHSNPRADRRYAVDATATLIPRLRDRGFEFGTLCDGDDF